MDMIVLFSDSADEPSSRDGLPTLNIRSFDSYKLNRRSKSIFSAKVSKTYGFQNSKTCSEISRDMINH